MKFLLLTLVCVLVLECASDFLFSSLEWTALQIAADNGHPAVCELLIANKADVDTKNGCAFMFIISYCFRVALILKICF